MKKLLALLICIIVLGTCCLGFTSCAAADHGEYEVIAATSYEVIVGSDASGPITKTYVAFIYMDNGSACLRKDYQEEAVGAYDNLIIIGDSNKYVVVVGYRQIDEFLYLTQETYDAIFSEVTE